MLVGEGGGETQQGRVSVTRGTRPALEQNCGSVIGGERREESGTGVLGGVVDD